MPDSWEDLPLSADHIESLQASGITLEVAAARGYRTVHEPSELTSLGFSPRQAPASRLPGLVIPMYRPGLRGPNPEPSGHQLRPALARRIRGREIKYETPAGLANILDVHPHMAEAAGDPARRLFVVEGVKKADALVSRGEVALAIAGVWSWRGTNASGGKTALPGFDDVALNGREVYVTFDSDALDKAQVMVAMTRLVNFLRARRAKAMFLVVPPEGEEKRGADDFLADGNSVSDLLEHAREQAPVTPATTLTARVTAEVSGGHIFLPEWNKWMYWDGRRWAIDPRGLRLESRLVGIIDPRGRHLADDLLRSVQATRALLERDIEHFHVSTERLDAWPRLLNCANGIVDLDTGELSPHDPARLLTKVTAGNYRPGVMNPDVAAVTQGLVPPDAVEWLQTFVGYSIRGEITEEIFVVLDGRGSNGKTTLLEGLQVALGDYCDAIPPRLLMGAGSEHPTLEADLFGMRLVYAVETGEDGVLAIDRVKAYTGGDRRKARRMREDYWAFDPTHTLVLATNHRPEIPSSDYGSWRRMRLVPFPYRFVAEPNLPNDRPGDPELRQRLRTLQPCWDAFVTWAVEGSMRYATQRLTETPESIAAATAAWRDESDPMALFIREQTVVGPEEHVDQALLASRFNEWRTQAGARGPSWSTQKIRTELSNAADANGWQVEYARSNGRRLIRGIRLVRVGEQPCDTSPTPAPAAGKPDSWDWFRSSGDLAAESDNVQAER